LGNCPEERCQAPLPNYPTSIVIPQTTPAPVCYPGSNDPRCPKYNLHLNI